MVLYIAVCDDEPVFTEHIRNLLVSDSVLKGYELNIEIYQSGAATASCAFIKAIWCRSAMWQGGRKSSCGWKTGR